MNIIAWEWFLQSLYDARCEKNVKNQGSGNEVQEGKKKRKKGRLEKAALKQEERGDEDRLECQKNMYILYRIRCRERIDRAQPASSAGGMHRDALSVDLFWLRFPYRLWRTMETTGKLLNVSLFLIYLRSLKLFEW